MFHIGAKDIVEAIASTKNYHYFIEYHLVPREMIPLHLAPNLLEDLEVGDVQFGQVVGEVVRKKVAKKEVGTLYMKFLQGHQRKKSDREEMQKILAHSLTKASAQAAAPPGQV